MSEVSSDDKYKVKPGDKAHNQAHYEALGEVKATNFFVPKLLMCHLQVITEEVYRILEAEGGLEKREVVSAGSRNGPRSFVFVSPGFQEKERLQVHLHICKRTPETAAPRCSSTALEWSELASGPAS